MLNVITKIILMVLTLLLSITILIFSGVAICVAAYWIDYLVNQLGTYILFPLVKFLTTG